MLKVDLFHLGPQKTATTWLYECVTEHPGACCARHDAVHYYDMHFARGPEWYERFFPERDASKRVIDFTPSYLRSTWAPRRIFGDNPHAQLVVCLRHPVERAFSHYWHEKKKRTISFEFREVLRNYDLYQSYLEPGFYAEHLERFLELFPRHAILVQHFEHLRRDPGRFLDEFLTFAGLEGDFHPSVLNRRRNTAGPVRRPVQRVVGEATETLLSALPESARRFFLGSRLVRALSGRREYIEGISPELFEELLVLCEPEIRRVEALLDMELPAWRRPPAQP